MPTVQVENLRFAIRTNFDGQKYDDWVHYQQVLKPQRQFSAVDLVVVRFRNAPPAVWLVEAKDYRIINNPPLRSNLAELPETVAKKVTDTLKGLEHAAGAAQQQSERALAIRAVNARSRRVVLHLEPHAGPKSKLFPKNFSASVLQKLKPLVRAIDHRPLVLTIANSEEAGVPWRVS